MKEYIGYGGNKVFVDGNNIHIKQLFISEKCTFDDVTGLNFTEPTALKNGCLVINTKKNHFELFFLKKQLQSFKDLYSILIQATEKKIDNLNADTQTNNLKNEVKNIMNYVVLQVILKEKFIGTGSGNLTELENVINTQAAKGYRLHTISTTSSGSKGMLGGDRIQATLVFEKII